MTFQFTASTRVAIQSYQVEGFELNWKATSSFESVYIPPKKPDSKHPSSSRSLSDLPRFLHIQQLPRQGHTDQVLLYGQPSTSDIGIFHLGVFLDKTECIGTATVEVVSVRV